jgi:tetratricopeptide (TPR) repeat protein
MKKTILILLLGSILISAAASAQSASSKDINQAFYSANNFYEKREYGKALGDYLKILSQGIESGPLYYNIGNAYFKLGKVGYAIWAFEKARKIAPRDSDIRSNHEYAKTFVESPSYSVPEKNLIVRLFEVPYRAFNLNVLALIMAFFYLMSTVFISATIIYRPLGRKIRLLTVTFTVWFIFTLMSFGIRYCSDELLKYGIVVEKCIDCKYEPIEGTTDFYKLNEGEKVIILKTRNDWRQVKRLDGKIGWVRKGAVEAI